MNRAQEDCADLIPRKIIGSVRLEVTFCGRRHSCLCLLLLLLRGGYKKNKKTTRGTDAFLECCGGKKEKTKKNRPKTGQRPPHAHHV